MGGKTSQSTQQVTIPPDVLARYNSVNANAQQVSQTPFQQYGGEFVSPVNQQQQAGIAATNQAAGMAQPYYGAATQQLMGAQGAGQNYYGAATAATQGAYQGAQPYNQAATNLALMGAGPVNAQQIGGQQIGHFMSPYLGSVVGSEAALLNQNNQQAMSGQLGSAIQSGAFGGDRGGVAAANLAQQQQLANANIYSGLLNQGYGQALSAAQQQQGVNLSAEQANRAALQQASGQLAGIGQQGYAQGTGTGAQLASLGQGVYGMSAGTSQALAGLGAGAQEAALQGAQAQLGAGTLQQQTQQAQDTALYNQFLQQQSYPFQTAQFMANIAEGTGALSGSTTNTTQPGALLARGGTADRRHARYAGGLVPSSEGGAVGYEHAGEGFAGGGSLMTPGANDYGAILDAQEQMYAPFAQAGLYGGQASGMPHGGASYVPAATVPVGHLAVAGGLQPQRTVAQQINDTSTAMKNLQGGFDSAKAAWGKASDFIDKQNKVSGLSSATGGRANYANGGSADDPYQNSGLGLDIPDENSHAQLAVAGGLPGGQKSGLGQLGDAAGAIGSMAKLGGSLAGLGGAAGAAEAAGAAGAAGGIGGTIASALPFLAMLNTGGSVTGRQHRATGGLAGFADGGLAARIAELNAPTSFDRNLIPEIGGLGGGDPPDEPGAVSQGEKPPGLGGLLPHVSVQADVSPEAQHAVSLAKSVSSPSDLNSILPLIAKVEGYGKNPLSSAQGKYQITDPTFVSLFHQMHPNEAGSMSKDQILALRGTPQGAQLSESMGPFLAQSNAQALKASGLPVNAQTVYMAHLLGPHFAVQTLTADPSTPLAKILPVNFVSANSRLMRDKTAGDLQNEVGGMLGRASRGAFARGGYLFGGAPSDPTQDTPTEDQAAGDVSGGLPAGLAAIAGAPAPALEQAPKGGLVPKSEPAPAQAPKGGLVPKSEPAPAQAPKGGLVPKSEPAPAQAPKGGLATKDEPAPPSMDITVPADMQQKTVAPKDHSTLVKTLSDPNVFIPILTGLGAMASAPTRNFGTALLVGASAGANSYQNQRQFGLQQQATAQNQQSVNIQARATAGAQKARQVEIYLSPYEAALKSAQTMADKAHVLDTLASVFPLTPQMGAGTSAGMAIHPFTKQLIPLSEYAADRAAFMGTAAKEIGLSGDLAATYAGQTPSSGAPPAAKGTPPAAVSGAPVPAGAPVSAPVVHAHATAPVAAPQAALDVSKPIDPAKASPQMLSARYAAHLPAPPAPDSSVLSGNNNPDTLLALANRASATGDKAGYENLMAQRQDILTGRTLPTDSSGHVFYGYRNAAAAQGNNEATIASYGKHRDALNANAAAFSTQLQAQQQAVDALKGVYSRNNTNVASHDVAQAIGTLATFLPVPAGASEYQSGVAEGNKFASILATSQAANSGLGHGAPEASLNQANMSAPFPTLPPAAKYSLLSHAQAVLDQNKAFYQQWQKDAPNVTNVPLYQQDWMAAHPISEFLPGAVARTPFSAGMSPEEMSDAVIKNGLRPREGQWVRGYPDPRPGRKGKTISGYWYNGGIHPAGPKG